MTYSNDNEQPPQVHEPSHVMSKKWIIMFTLRPWPLLYQGVTLSISILNCFSIIKIMGISYNQPDHITSISHPKVPFFKTRILASRKLYWIPFFVFNFWLSLALMTINIFLLDLFPAHWLISFLSKQRL